MAFSYYSYNNLFQGFIVPDELGYLNNLGKYEDKDVVLQLPG